MFTVFGVPGGSQGCPGGVFFLFFFGGGGVPKGFGGFVSDYVWQYLWAKSLESTASSNFLHCCASRVLSNSERRGFWRGGASVPAMNVTFLPRKYSPLLIFPSRRFVNSCRQKRLPQALRNEVSQFFKASFFPLEKFKLHASTNFQGNHPTPWFVLK